MKVLMINGSPHAHGSTASALGQVSEELDKWGIEADIFHIGQKVIRGCIACYKCAKTGYCIFTDDPVNDGINRLKAADALIVGTPVYYAGANATVCAFMDRVFFLKSGPYAFKPAATVVSCRRGGASSAFDRINKYFTHAQMPVVSSQYWNDVHGSNAEEERQDLEGIQTMQVLGRNMAWLLMCIDAGRKAGIGYPVREEKIRTSFIR